MVIVESKVSRSWPALGLKIQRGTNEFEAISPVHRAMLSAYTASGQMAIVEDKPAADPAQGKPLEASFEGEALAAAAGTSATKLVKHTPPKRAPEPKG